MGLEDKAVFHCITDRTIWGSTRVCLFELIAIPLGDNMPDVVMLGLQVFHTHILLSSSYGGWKRLL